MDARRVIANLRAHERDLKEAGIVRLSLFGSTARGDAGPESDVDLLAAFNESRRISLLDIAGMELELSEMLGCKVDLVEEGTLKPRVRKRVEDEALRAFSRSWWKRGGSFKKARYNNGLDREPATLLPVGVYSVEATATGATVTLPNN